VTGASSGVARASAGDDLRLARLHLRLGSLTLASAELEAIVGSSDDPSADSLAALAEARWRLGDDVGAAEAADRHLDLGGSDPLTIAIAAEAAAAEGRPDDAQSLIDRLEPIDAVALDRLFAGMPRRAAWSAGPPERPDLDELRRLAAGHAPTVADAAASAAARDARARRAGKSPGRTGSPEPGAASSELGMASPAPSSAAPTGAAEGPSFVDASEAIARARNELGTAPERAFLRLALALRWDPAVAETVADLLRGRDEPGAAVVRGDALRLLGRHDEADASYDAAAEAVDA